MHHYTANDKYLHSSTTCSELLILHDSAIYTFHLGKDGSMQGEPVSE